MSDAIAKPRWYHVTPDRFLIGLLAAVLLLLAADRFELLGLTRGSGWNVLLAAAVVCLGMLSGILWFVASLLLRRRFQFSLKSVFVLTLIVAILCSWLAVKKQQANRQKAAVEAIDRLEGQVAYDHEVDLAHDDFNKQELPEDAASRIAAFCRRLIGTDVLSHVATVEIRCVEVTDAELVHLKELTNLRFLWLISSKVTDAGLVHLKELTKLRTLIIEDTQVTDDGVDKLKQAFPNCKILR